MLFIEGYKLCIISLIAVKMRLLSSSFERASNPGQTQTGLGPRVYHFTTPGCCTA